MRREVIAKFRRRSRVEIPDAKELRAESEILMRTHVAMNLAQIGDPLFNCPVEVAVSKQELSPNDRPDIHARLQ
jgi:hypothetical protein